MFGIDEIECTLTGALVTYGKEIAHGGTAAMVVFESCALFALASEYNIKKIGNDINIKQTSQPLVNIILLLRARNDDKQLWPTSRANTFLQALKMFCLHHNLSKDSLNV